MILNDVIQDYQFIDTKLSECKDYLEKSQIILNNYYHMTSASIGKFYGGANTDSAQNTLVTELSSTMMRCFSLVTKLNSSAFTFYSCLNSLQARQYSSDIIAQDVSNLYNAAQEVILNSNTIIEEQCEGMKKKNLIRNLIIAIIELLNMYQRIKSHCDLLLNIENQLLEPLPDTEDSDAFSEFELRSYKSSLSMTEYSDDLASLSSFISQFERIKANTERAGKIYLRKIESGSLRVVWGSKTIELGGISEIIKALFDGIRTLRLIGAEKKLAEEQARSQKLDNDAKELAIINSQISTLSTTLGLSKDNPDDVETLQRLCLPLVRYINNNPVGKAGNLKYDITSEVKLLEDFYYQKPADVNINQAESTSQDNNPKN